MSNNVFNLQEPKYKHLEKKYRGCGHGWADVSKNGDLLDFCYSDNFETEISTQNVDMVFNGGMILKEEKTFVRYVANFSCYEICLF
tara:strand:+ start:175 stop:432 length:258 start_codon:yes stop_codon:yes gene_type:complete